MGLKLKEYWNIQLCHRLLCLWYHETSMICIFFYEKKNFLDNALVTLHALCHNKQDKVSAISA